ncbi:MAG: DUF502 domain-containing protein [Micavibrio sp.]
MAEHPDNPIAEDVDDMLSTPRGGLLVRLRRYFLTGIVVTAPGVITIYVTWWFLKFVDTNVAKLIPSAYNPNTYLPVSVPGLGLILTVTILIAVGWFARNFVGRMFIHSSEYVVERMPVVRTVYNALKQVFETTMGAQSRAFREVVLFEYPRKDCWTLGFVTGVTRGEIQSLTDDEVVNVYVPTTPNPTSGFLLFLPRKDLTYLSMSPEDAIKLIVSGGIISPPEKSL